MICFRFCLAVSLFCSLFQLTSWVQNEMKTQGSFLRIPITKYNTSFKGRKNQFQKSQRRHVTVDSNKILHMQTVFWQSWSICHAAYLFLQVKIVIRKPEFHSLIIFFAVLSKRYCTFCCLWSIISLKINIHLWLSKTNRMFSANCRMYGKVLLYKVYQTVRFRTCAYGVTV